EHRYPPCCSYVMRKMGRWSSPMGIIVFVPSTGSTRTPGSAARLSRVWERRVGSLCSLRTCPACGELSRAEHYRKRRCQESFRGAWRADFFKELDRLIANQRATRPLYVCLCHLIPLPLDCRALRFQRIVRADSKG